MGKKANETETQTEDVTPQTETPEAETSETETSKKTEAAKTETAKTETKPEKTYTESQITARLEKERKKWEKEKDLPEIERLKKENETYAKEKLERQVSADFATAAEAAGAKNASHLYKIYGADLEISEDGKIENLKDVLDAAQEEMPELFPSKTPGSSDAEKGKTPAKLTVAEQVDAEFEKTGRTSAFKI